jgi:hypothetical protein
MKHSMPVLLAFLLLSTSAVYAQPVPSAPYTGTPAGTSSGEVLWSQLDDPTGAAFTDQAFEAPYAAYDSSGADDFSMESSLWAVETLFTPGSVTVAGSNPFFVNVTFYEDAGGVPGAVYFGCDFPANTNFTSDGDGDITTDMTGFCDIYGDGVFWVSQQVRMDFDPLGQHYWATRSTAAGTYPGVWKNPGNGFGNGCLDWQPANAICGMTGEDWMFELSGGVGSVDDWGGIPAVGPFGVVLMVLALVGGSAYVIRRRR